jgi:hypothetical protein
MKPTRLLWLAAILTIGAINFSCAAHDDRRDDRRSDRRDDRSDSWDNWWDRLLGSRDPARDLEGTWYVNGDRNIRARILSLRGGGFEGINQHGDKSRIEVDKNGDIRALDWGRDLRGIVRRDTIEWTNGVTWTREPSGRSR